MGKPKKIFFDAHSLIGHRTGIGNYVYGLLQALDQRNPNKHKIRLMLQYEHMDNVPLFKSKLIKYRLIRFAPKRIFSKLQNRNLLPPMDVLFGRGLYLFPNYIRWPLLFSKSVIIVCDTVSISHPEYIEPKTARWLTSHMRKSIKHSQHVVTISESSKQDIMTHYHVPEANISIVYPAVDQTVFYRRNSDEIKEAKGKYGIFGDYLLFVSTLEPRKNVENLAKAFRMLDKKFIEQYSLVLVGGRGWHDKEIRQTLQEARKNGYRIVLPGFVDDEDMPALYSGATLFTYPSNYEGFGIPVLEAMATGCPVLTTDNSSLPEVGGEAVYYCKTDVNSIHKAMHTLLTNKGLRTELSKKGAEQVRHFSWADSAQKLVTILEQKVR